MAFYMVYKDELCRVVHLSGKPGYVRELNSRQESVRKNIAFDKFTFIGLHQCLVDCCAWPLCIVSFKGFAASYMSIFF